MEKRPFVDPGVRQAVIRLLQAGWTYLETAQVFGIGSATVNRIWRRFRLTGLHTLGPRGGGRKRAILPEQEQSFRDMVKKYNDATYPELALIWHKKTGKRVSRAVIVRMVKKLGFSRKKKTTRPKARLSRSAILKRLQFKKYVKKIQPEKLVFLDESGFQQAMRRTYARSPVGRRAFSFPSALRSRNITVCGAIRKSGIVAMQAKPSSMTRKWFVSFLDRKLFPRMKPGDVLVLDNLSSHRGQSVRKIAEQWSIRLLYLPPYCPELNAIESVWSWLKNRVRARLENYREKFRYTIAAAWRAVATLNLSKTIQNCLP